MEHTRIGALGAYQVHGISEGASAGGRKHAQNRYDALDRFQYFISRFKIAKCSCFILKKSGDGLVRVANLKVLGEWMFGQRKVGRLFVISQSGLENFSKTRRS